MSKASQNKEELELFINWLDNYCGKEKNLGVDVVLEIGVHKGYSMQLWKDLFRPTTIIGIEIDENNMGNDIPEGSIVIYGDSHKLETRTDVITVLDERKVDFLFIDGDHMYDGVKLDYEMYSPLVKSGGIIAFHDAVLTSNPGVEVYKFWNEIKKETHVHLIDVEGQNGTGFGAVIKK